MVDNPLAANALDPRAGGGAEDRDAPPLMQSSILLKDKHEKNNRLIQVLTSTFFVLLLFYGFVWLRDYLKSGSTDIEIPHDVDTESCPSCIDYERLRNMSTELPNIENYLTTKINEARTIDYGEKKDRDLGSLDNFNKKVAKMPELKVKIDELVTLDGKLKYYVEQSSGLAAKIKELKGQYENKTKQIEQLTREAVANLKILREISSNKPQYEGKLQDLDTGIKAQRDQQELKRREFDDRLQKIRDQIGELLRKGQVRREEDIDRNVDRKEKDVAHHEEEREQCRREVREAEEGLRGLYDKIQNHTYEVHSEKLRQHTRGVIEDAIKVVRMIEDLRKRSIYEASENINEIIRSVAQKEKNLIAYELDPNTDKELVRNLRVTIQKEQSLLKAWVQEQFKTLRLIRDEIQELEEYIADLRRMHGYYEEEEEAKAPKKKDTDLIRLEEEIRNLEKKKQRCVDLIKRKTEEATREQREITELKDIRGRIATLNNEVAEEEKKWNAERDTLGSKIEQLVQERKQIAEALSQAQDSDREIDRKLRDFSNRYNAKLQENPSPAYLNKTVTKYEDMTVSAFQVYEHMEKLFKEITVLLAS